MAAKLAFQVLFQFTDTASYPGAFLDAVHVARGFPRRTIHNIVLCRISPSDTQNKRYSHFLYDVDEKFLAIFKNYCMNLNMI